MWIGLVSGVVELWEVWVCAGRSISIFHSWLLVHLSLSVIPAVPAEGRNGSDGREALTLGGEGQGLGAARVLPGVFAPVKAPSQLPGPKKGNW